MSKARDTTLVLETVKLDGFDYEVDIKRRENVRTLQLEMRLDGRRSRVSARTTNQGEARTAAEDWIRAVVREMHGGELGLLKNKVSAGGQITVGELFDVFRERRLPYLRRDYKRMCRKVIVVWETELGRDFPIAMFGQNTIDEHARIRREGGLAIPTTNGRGVAVTRVLKPVGPTTIRHDIGFLSLVLKYLQREKQSNGEPLLARNPVDGLVWPKEGEQRRPDMSDKRYNSMLIAADSYEETVLAHPTVSKHCHIPRGIMRTMLIVSRRTGRRVKSIRKLLVEHVLFERDSMRAQLAALGKPTDWADSWPWGAIFWQHDKMERRAVIPMGPELHLALREYVNARGEVCGDMPLFPAPSNIARCLSEARVMKWFERVERHGRSLGLELEHVKGGLWHQLRRQWRSERAGRFHEKLIAVCGGWKPGAAEGGVSEAMGLYYIPHPGAVFDCMRFTPEMLPPSAARPGVMVDMPPDEGPMQSIAA